MKVSSSINNKLTSFVLLLSLFSVSCRKLISIPAAPPTQIPQAGVFSDSADIQAAVAGVYANFKASAGAVSWMNGSITSITGLSSDELKGNSAYDQTNPQFYTETVAVDNGTVAANWKQAYGDLYQINACLVGIQGTTAISDSLKNLLSGQLKVVRAWYYFHMVNQWGGVPLITNQDYAVNAFLPRSSADSIYALIQSDLADARKTLPAAYAYADRFRPNLYVAEALSAKVDLYRQDWTDAATLAKDVISNGPYTLSTDLTTVFLDGSNEALWQLPAAGSNNQTAEAMNFVPASYINIPNFSLTPFLVNAFEAGDLRLTAWTGNKVYLGNTYYYPYKYKNTYNYLGPTTTEDYMLVRLAEVYLILAEAEAHNNQLSDAITNINMVRTRAGLGGTPATSQADILTAVMHERQTELFCEWGNRWYDLKRTGLVDSVMKAEKPTAWQSYQALYPIPKAEILLNTALIQNPQY